MFKVLCVLHFIFFFRTTQSLGIILSYALCIVYGSSLDVDSFGAMGDEKDMTLECSLSDKLCIIREQQYEIIIIPTLLVAAFLILLGVILWLFIKGKRSQQQSSGLQGKA